MDYLHNLLDSENLNLIIETFNKNVFDNLNKENMIAIINYLKENNITIIEDIITYYLDIFTIDINIFIKKFEKLKSNYKTNINEALSFKLDILEEMLD